MLFQLWTIRDLVRGDCLSVREGEHVRILRQTFDEQTIRFLPAVQMGAADIGFTEGMNEQTVNQHDGSHFPR